jgi:ubiquinone/menaquinone biosynthesis C-methylase UbiE
VSERLEQAGRRFARLATRAVVARPWLWRLFRPLLRVQFDRLAPIWDARRGPEAHAALEAAFDRLDTAPRRVLDVGTGTGQAARYIAARFNAAEVVGVDQSPAMIEEAGRRLPDDARERVRFEVADAAR